MASKDEKIALLLEEGQKLSQAELKFMNTIRKLRSRMGEDEKRIISLQRNVDETTKAMRASQDRAKRAETLQREEQARAGALSKVQKELEILKSNELSQSSHIQELQRRLAENEMGQGEIAAREGKAALEEERRLRNEVQEALISIKTEKEMSEGRHRKQMQDLQTQVDRERERSRLGELELRREINVRREFSTRSYTHTDDVQVLEARLEASQVQAEEVSTGKSGSMQAKLLRQIETLQTQYTIANENWRGIESSLLTRNANLEKEVDELRQKDAEARRKVRDHLSTIRRLQETLESGKNKQEDADEKLLDQQRKVASLQEALGRAEAAFVECRAEREAQKSSWETKLAALEAEKANVSTVFLEAPLLNLRVDSPLQPTQKKSTTTGGRASPHSARRHHSNFGLGLAGTSIPVSDRLSMRRSSSQVSHGSATPNRMDYVPPTSHHSSHQDVSESVSVNTEQQEDMFDGFLSPATPDRTINDMISVSTAAAGPSIQVVERMSAAVRKLESEKAASKDEISRLSGQRDEAREQIVVLMKEVDAKRATEDRIASLEAEKATMDRRYQTTLEMLGEKSELVEELRADVADVKQMYRDLVESTTK